MRSGLALQQLIRAIFQMGIQRIHNNVVHSSYATRKIYSEKFFLKASGMQ